MGSNFEGKLKRGETRVVLNETPHPRSLGGRDFLNLEEGRGHTARGGPVPLFISDDLRVVALPHRHTGVVSAEGDADREIRLCHPGTLREIGERGQAGQMGTLFGGDPSGGSLGDEMLK